MLIALNEAVVPWVDCLSECGTANWWIGEELTSTEEVLRLDDDEAEDFDVESLIALNECLVPTSFCENGGAAVPHMDILWPDWELYDSEEDSFELDIDMLIAMNVELKSDEGVAVRQSSNSGLLVDNEEDYLNYLHKLMEVDHAHVENEEVEKGQDQGVL